MARTQVVLSVVAVLALLAGCGTEPAAPVAITPVAAPVARAQPVSIGVAEVTDLGPVLTNRDGRTLYLFTRDFRNPSMSMCFDRCARQWQPVKATGEIVMSGAARKSVSTVVRPDGGTQVTVDGWPMYTYAWDTGPGQANGHGAQGTWFAVTPDGKKAGVPDRVAVKAADLPGFGPALTDLEGHPLYLFTQDGKSPSRPTCYGECAANWPPLLVTGEVVRNGVEPGLIGSVTRADGTSQVTVGGWPVYTFTKDTAPGQANGHGASGVWFVIEPAGCASTAPVTQQPPAEGPDGSTGY